jgi:hypothetical protein
MAICLSPNASSQEAAELLLLWQRADNLHWGGAVTADLLPGSDAELILTYHADLKNVTWNPQGKIAILQAKPNGWKVVFESPDPTNQATDGRETLAGNWSYHLAAVGDVTGDGLDDLLIEQQWSNAHYGYVSHTKLFTADLAKSGSLHIIYLEDGTFTRPNYAIVNQTVQSIIPLSGMDAITRTYQLDKNAFIMIEEMINTEAATLSATAAGGAVWYAFDVFDDVGGSPFHSPNHGLYCLKDGQVTRFDIPGTVRVLAVAPDGSLYVGAGWGVLRYHADQWETLLNVDGSQPSPVSDLAPLSIAFADSGDVWVGGAHKLARFDGEEWKEYDIPAVRVAIASDDTVWTVGWDGRADSDCCITHIAGSEWMTYTWTANVPVEPEVLQLLFD